MLWLEAPDGSATLVADASNARSASRAHTIRINSGFVRPGLINAHDHLHRNHYPRLGAPPYLNAYDWGDDLHASHADRIAQLRSFSRRDALLFGALKNVVAGVTTVVHHDAWEPAFEDAFPIRVAQLRTAHSLRFDPSVADTFAASIGQPIAIHLAEGVDEGSSAEVVAMEQAGWLNNQLLAVHAVGPDARGVALLTERGAAVVWCPTSNAFLFGRTAPRELIESVADVLIGSDALLTGAGTLLDELRAARAIGYLSDDQLLDAVGETARRRLGLPRTPADVTVFRRPVLDATAQDVALVIVAGRPVLADEEYAEVFELCGVASERLQIGAVDKIVAAPLASVAARVCELTPECARIFS